MEQSPSWETNRFSASQEILHLVWNLKVHYCVYKYLPPVPILSQINPGHALPLQFLIIHLNIIFLSMPRSFSSPLSLRFPQQNTVHSKNIIPCSYSAPFVPPNLLYTHIIELRKRIHGQWWTTQFNLLSSTSFFQSEKLFNYMHLPTA